MPPGTKLRNVRIPDEIWDPARDKAASEGVTMTDVIRAALIAYAEVTEH